MTFFACLPTCAFAGLLDKYKPEVCGRCHPAEFKKRVATLRPWAESITRAMTFGMPHLIQCDVCGNETARPRDGFCRRCGAPGDTSGARYISYQVIEGERLAHPDAWTRKSKTPKVEKPAPVKTGPEQTVSTILLAGPVVEKRKER